MATADRSRNEIDGTWQITMRPDLSPAHSAVLELSRDGDSLSAKIESADGTGTGEGFVDGSRMAWGV
ncbi:hypothetical protein [Streptomyces hokutonensis]|uniref:hypothetical protein n=1 Tax=Streptomyces hokutonensis TaxID=1306990 RepID=UPI0036A5D1E6